jgi:hypothetical protein
MNIPLGVANYHTTEQLLELALVILDNARRDERMPIINNWSQVISHLKLSVRRLQVTGLTSLLTLGAGALNFSIGG